MRYSQGSVPDIVSTARALEVSICRLGERGHATILMALSDLYVLLSAFPAYDCSKDTSWVYVE